MALSYYSNWAPPDYSIDDPELQSLLNADYYLVDPNDSSIHIPFDNLNSLSYAQPQTPFLLPQQETIFQYSPKSQKLCFDPTLSPLPGFSAGKKEGNGVSLSAQSIAARQRRRRITVKTQELGKLVPGAHKMNTAEMLHSAYKYIKFLQAQLALLELLASEVTQGQQEFQILLQSPLIQEKLYSTENCLLPHKLVEQLRRHHHQMLKSNPHLLPTFEKDR